MKIIPVIDLKNGLAVHARQGLRTHYQPINSPLCRSAAVFDVIEAYLSLYAFDTFYIADLDAISNKGNHDRLIAEVAAAYPKLTLWLDQGYRQAPDKPGPHWPVVGTESYTDDRLDAVAKFNRRFILSLDYPPTSAPTGKLFYDSLLWPEHVIIMTLAKVGSHGGPDFATLAEYVQRFPNHTFIAAGGIRNAADLRDLSQMGIRHALVASSLHSGALSAYDIKLMSNRPSPLRS